MYVCTYVCRYVCMYVCAYIYIYTHRYTVGKYDYDHRALCCSLAGSRPGHLSGRGCDHEALGTVSLVDPWGSKQPQVASIDIL